MQHIIIQQIQSHPAYLPLLCQSICLHLNCKASKGLGPWSFTVLPCPFFQYEQLSKLGVTSGHTPKVGKSGSRHPFTRTLAHNSRRGLGRRAVPCHAPLPLDFSCAAEMPCCHRIRPPRATRSSAVGGERNPWATWSKAASGVTGRPAAEQGPCEHTRLLTSMIAAQIQFKSA